LDEFSIRVVGSMVKRYGDLPAVSKSAVAKKDADEFG